jgi:hypothetical protein
MLEDEILILAFITDYSYHQTARHEAVDSVTA